MTQRQILTLEAREANRKLASLKNQRASSVAPERQRQYSREILKVENRLYKILEARAMSL
jgi:hypothetical protein